MRHHHALLFCLVIYAYICPVMNVLVLAPHPFYQERGTPIAVDLLLSAMSEMGHIVDVLTYHEGSPRQYKGVTIHRIRRPPFATGIPPGPSWKKILCDGVMYRHALQLAATRRYDLVHAVEESVYMARRIQARFGTPYVYDMDSSLARQIAEKYPLARVLLTPLSRLEGSAIRQALAVVPVCDALSEIARQEGAKAIFLLRDISLLAPAVPAEADHVKRLIPPDGTPTLMYIGNLERYQGIDLMLEAFALYRTGGGTARLVIAGGKQRDIEAYRRKATRISLGDAILFLGPQPISRMAALIKRADVLLSPRIKGNNTPMKIYSYLASGVAILATDLPTHTQVLTPRVACLEEARAPAMAKAMARLISDPGYRHTLAAAALQLSETSYSPAAFKSTVGRLYDWLSAHLPRP